MFSELEKKIGSGGNLNEAYKYISCCVWVENAFLTFKNYLTFTSGANVVPRISLTDNF